MDWMVAVIWRVCVAAVAGSIAAAQAPECPFEKPLDVPTAVRVLESAKEAYQLEHTAISLVQAKDPGALDRLVPFLRNSKLLERLDGDRYPRRLSRIVLAVGKLGTPKAEEVLLELARDKTFTEDANRIDSVIDAGGWVPKPSAKLLQFLDEKSTPKSGYQNRVVAALVRIRTPESLAMVEKRMLSQAYESSSKQGWLASYLVYGRNDLAIVAIYRQLLKADLDEELRSLVVLTLFADSPQAWSPFQRTPLPKWKDAPTEVLREVLELADVSVKLNVPADTKEAVRKARKEIEAILAERKQK
jgi:hypothetical protein